MKCYYVSSKFLRFSLKMDVKGGGSTSWLIPDYNLMYEKLKNLNVSKTDTKKGRFSDFQVMPWLIMSV